MSERRAGSRRIRNRIALMLLGVPVLMPPHFASANAETIRQPISLPIEVVGDDGTTVTVSIFIPPAGIQEVNSLYLQIHGLEYADEAGIRINQSPWVALNNGTVTVAKPGKGYGGIGGAFATLKMTLPVAPGSIVSGMNTIQFRFNYSDGVVSGYRILAFNFLDSLDRPILPADAFVQEDPSSWQPPLADSASSFAGKLLWLGAPLIANNRQKAPALQAHCADCHTRDGRDLKYFNYSNGSIVARARFHGLSTLQGQQIASYIRTLPYSNPGRPWNPPYQPGPYLDSQPVANWAAGAGLAQVLASDSETLTFLFPGRAGTLAITPASFPPDGHQNARVLPIAMQLPDWNHWLPRTHPLDASNLHFSGSDFARFYETLDYNRLGDKADARAFFDRWTQARGRFLVPHLSATSPKWTPALSTAYYSAQLWQLVKTWEIVQQASLEQASGRSWPNAVPSGTAPATVGIPDSPDGMNASALTSEYFNNAWYELQLLVSNRSERPQSARDGPYLAEHILSLQQHSGIPEPGRLLVTLIDSLQSTGPPGTPNAWRPDRGIDPRILTAPAFAPVFQFVAPEVRKALTESLLAAWLDKTLSYPQTSYFHRGQLPGAYEMPGELRAISGGRVWEAAPQFRAAGVSTPLVRRLQDWGQTYAAMTQLFHY